MPPPWIALPGLDPFEPATQGMPEVYIMLNWLPFWRTPGQGEKAAYLDRWAADADWRAVIAERYEEDGIDWAEEARFDAAQREAFLRQQEAPRPWWRFGR